VTTQGGHEFLLGAYRALLKDAIRWIPELNRKAIEWDLIQLERLVVSKGLRYFTIDLPEFGKAFEAALDSGTLGACTVPGFGRLRAKRRPDDKRPRLFWAFLSRVLTSACHLKENPCTLSIFFVRQLCYLSKKIKGECRDEFKFSTIQEFYEIEAGLLEPSLNWEEPMACFDTDDLLMVSFNDLPHRGDVSDEPKDGISNTSDGCLGVLQRVCDTLTGRLIPDIDPSSLRGRHGPGSVSDAGPGDDKYHFPNWPDKLQSIFPYDWHASTNLMTDGESPSNGEVYSKLICVPKTQKGPRLIASEPVCNQWIQQAVAQVILDALCSWEIPRAVKIRDQSLNQQKAHLASLGGFATIDLSAASDRLSCYVVERVFRRNPKLLACFMACRTQLLINRIDKKSPRELLLKKFAMMGSALTFPVQTYVFLCCCLASVLHRREMRVSLHNIAKVLDEIAVYGDDLIVPVDSTPVLVDLLDRLGLKVNVHKSFWTGKFRESCGTDWYDGENVTPIYIRSDFDPHKPGTAWGVIEVSNNLYKAGLWELSSYISSRVPLGLLLKLPIEDGSVALKGLFSFMGVKINHLRTRWNPNLQRTEYRVAHLKSFIGNKVPEGIARLRRYFTERPDPNLIWDPHLRVREVPSLKTKYLPLYGGAT